MLKTYEDFLRRADTLGFFFLSGKNMDGLPTLERETNPEQWHTGIPETDPWQWKDRAAQEKKLAFGCILGGNKGFVSKRMYSLFYTACSPSDELQDCYEDGELSRSAMDLYQLFQDGAVLSTADIHKKLEVTKKAGASRADSALKELQKRYIITVCGNKRKVSADGLPYGWPANTYCLVENWVSQDWLNGAQQLTQAEAKKKILDAGCAMGNSVDRLKLSKLLFSK